MKTERKGVRIKQEDFDIYVKGQRLKARTLKHELNRKNTSPLLVFLHEALESITQWKDFPESLVNHSGLDALVYDRLGHGQSDPREKRRGVSYRHREALEYLPEVLKQSGVEEVILIGHSDGGTIALIYAAEHPGCVRGIITEAAHVFVDKVTLGGIRNLIEEYKTTDLKEMLASHHGEHTDWLFKDWSERWLSADFRNWNIEETLPRIKALLLAIQGEDDGYATPLQVEGITGQVEGKSEQVLLSDCAHIPYKQARECVLEEIRTFILSIIN